MSRKIYLTPLILLLISTSAWAQGFYIGAGLGPDTADFKQARNVTRLGSFNVKDTTHLSGTGLFGSIFGGYGWNRNAFYLAGEINANASSVSFDSSNYEFVHSNFADTHYKIEHSFGVSLLPGYLLTDATLFYARVGYANGYFKISTTDSSLANVHKNLSGLRLGLGVNQSFTQQLGARMEYNHISYQSTSFSIVDGLTTIATRISPETNQVEFSLFYKFG